MIIELPNYISNQDIDFITESCRKIAKNTIITPGYNRDGITIEITATPHVKEVDNKIHNIMDTIQEKIIEYRYKPPFKSGDSGYEYHCYNPGDVCHFHADGEVMKGFLRYASVIIHLTTNKEGGELIFPSQNKVVKTEKGKVVIFPPYGMFGHYVTPSNTPREVIVSWFVYQGITINT